MFNYSKIKLFSKSGFEIPNDVEKTYFYNVSSDLKGSRNAVLYGISELNQDGTIKNNLSSLESYDSGITFSSKDNVFDISIGCLYNVENLSDYKLISVDDCSLLEMEIDNDYTDYEHKYYGIKNVRLNQPIEIKSELKFPSIKYNGILNFENVSTELYETESIYILKETIDGSVKTYSKITSSDVESGRYKLLFLINSESENEFKLFTVDEKSNDLVFRNSQELTFTDDENTGYKLNIAFSAKDEGVYEETLYMCIIDTLNDDEPYLLGTIKLHAESIGEDERYRTLFANFGIPDPKDYLDIFKDAGTLEELNDKELLNRKSKELFLTYDNIFPYVGTYKALINAINYLGYTDISFKEWYKNTSVIEGKPKYVSYDVAYKNEYSKNRINSLSIEERLSIKKLNWLTMKYKLNYEDEYAIDTQDNIIQSPDVPHLIKAEYTYRNDEVLVKLYALKKWLEKNIIAQNCRITEIVGEGIYVERYAYNVYGNVNENYDFNNDLNVSPYLRGNPDDRILKDGSAYISVGIKELDDFTKRSVKTTIESVKNKNFENISDAELYIDVENRIVKPISEGYDSSKALEGKHIIINSTFVHPANFDYVSIKANNSSNEYMFRTPYVDGSNNLWIHEGEIMFEPRNYKDDAISKQVEFDILPEIYVENAYLRKTNTSWTDDSTNIVYSIEKIIENGLLNYKLTNWITGEYEIFDDYVILKSDVSANLKYTEYNYFNVPLFIINNFKITKSSIFSNVENYVLEIRDGKFAFENSENDKYLYLNFNYDSISDEQDIEVNTTYIVDKIPTNITNYDANFIDKYLTNPDTAFEYNDSFNIKVNKTGLYDVYVYAFDKYNNVYGKKIIGNPEITLVSPEINYILEQTNSKNDEDFYKYNKNGVLYEGELNFENVPIFKPTYLVNDIEIKDNSICYKNISYAIDTPKQEDTTRIYNATDRFIFKTFDASPYIVERIGSAKSNCFPKKVNKVQCVVFDTTYDNPIALSDGSLYVENSIYKLSVIDSSFINMFKDVNNPPHLYIRNINRYDASIINDDNKTFIKINIDDDFANNEIYKKCQKIKLLTKNIINELIYSYGVYSIEDISINGNECLIEVDTFINAEFANKHKLYVTYPNDDFINYIINVKDVHELITGDVILNLYEDDMIDYVDNTYSIGYRDFDIKNAYNDWVKTNSFGNLYKYDIPVTLKTTQKIICKPNTPKYVIKNPSYYWKVYKHIENYNHKKYYEVYNNSLFLNIDENGIYDVELWTYDEYGNLISKMNKGSFKK